LYSAIGINPKEHFKSLESILDKPNAEGKIDNPRKGKGGKSILFKGAHNSEQLSTLEYLNGFYNSRKRYNADETGFYKQAIDEFVASARTTGMGQSFKDFANNDNIRLVPGNAGVGKTTYVINTLNMMSKSTSDSDIVLVAPYKEQLDNLVKNAAAAGIDTSKTTNLLFDELHRKYKGMKDKSIFVDEYTLSNPSKIKDIVKDNLLDSSNIAMFLGDNGQAGPSKDRMAFDLEKFVVKTANMTTVMRTGSVDVSQLQGVFRATLATGEASPAELYLPSFYHMGEKGNYRCKKI